MKIRFNKQQLNNLSVAQFLRQAGYTPLPQNRRGEESFARRLGRDFYPRFHIYPSLEGENGYLNLHLDQKKPSYQGQTAHSGEYDGELVERETKRLQSLFSDNIFNFN
jgi:hypothetical protein